LPKPEEEDSRELKRDIGIWGSFAMGYADVGADVYVALGVIAAFAGVVSPIAFGIAAITYVCTGLCYAELATAYPVAGGGQFYSLKAFGKIHGFVAGWGLMLDYTIDIALFALATVGYLGFITNMVTHSSLLFVSPYYGITAIALILLLLVLNLLGIRYSSKFNELVVLVGLVTVGIFFAVGVPSIIMSGALSAWLGQAANAFKTGIFGMPGGGYGSFVYAVSLATASYIGIESISQAAEETRHPAHVIPRATKGAIVSVIAVAVTLSLLSVTLTPWQAIAGNSQDPAVVIAQYLPYIGAWFALWVGIVGAFSCYVSTNTGVIGVSRVTFSMGRLGLLPKGLGRISYRYRTPYITIIIFSLVACLLLVVNLALPGPELLGLVTSLYNFGALVAYMYVNAAAIVLRFKEPERKGWKMPLNVAVSRKGRRFEVSLVPVAGLISSIVVWLIIVGTHSMGRTIGTIWFIVGIAGYLIYQRFKGGENAND
jgi:APA family basic amino acid/polyamine antiporter